MKTRVLACLARLALAVLLLTILVPASPRVLAAAPAPQQGEQIPRPLDGEAVAPSPEGAALAGATRTLHFPAQSLNYVPSFGVITQYGGGTTAGLRWTASAGAGSAALLNIPRPSDWDGISPVLMHLYFTAITAGSGNISFFIRPRAFDAGNTYSDAGSITSTAVPYASGRVLKQSFTIPPERFGSKALWVIGIQRSDTYAGDVNLLSVGLTYTRFSTSSGSLGYPANAINYNSSYGAITPYGGGTLGGLSWAPGGAAGSAAHLDIPRPADWDGVSSITVRLYIKPTTSNAGYVNMFIRPRSYNAGDTHSDAAGVTGSAVYVSSADVVLRQSFTVPAGGMTDSLWVIAMQRGGSGETYPDAVTLLAVGLTYTAQSTETASLGFAANGLNYNSTGGFATQYGGGTVAGLLWKGVGTAIFLDIPRPYNWDRVSNVTMRVYFMPTTATAGNVDFFIRPRAYNAGDTYADAASVTSTPLAAAGTNRVSRQTFSIPASRFGAKDLWVIAIQRAGPGQTYNDDIVFLAAEINYRAVERIYLPLLMR